MGVGKSCRNRGKDKLYLCCRDMSLPGPGMASASDMDTVMRIPLVVPGIDFGRALPEGHPGMERNVAAVRDRGDGAGASLGELAAT